MSWSVVLPLFKTTMNALGYTEHTDAFNFENIAASRLDKGYHLSVGSIAGVGQNQSDIETNIPVTVRFFKKGFRDPAGARDSAITLAETIVTTLLAPAKRVGTSGIKNILFNSATPDPLAESNDNTILMTLEFTVFVILGV